MADNLGRVKQSKHEKSLKVLTTRFMDLMQGAEDGFIDLKVAAHLLEVQKRKVLEISLVLEGIGLIEKKSKNCYQWKGASTVCYNSQEVNEEVTELKDQIKKLEQHEEMLDLHTQWIKQSLRNNDCDTLKHIYIKYEDLKDNFKDEFILAVQAPSDTRLEVRKLEKVLEDSNSNQNKIHLEMYLKSTTGKIFGHFVQPE